MLFSAKNPRIKSQKPNSSLAPNLLSSLWVLVSLDPNGSHLGKILPPQKVQQEMVKSRP